MTILAGPTGADDLVVRGARVLDPAEGIDGVLDVRVDRGVISEIGPGCMTFCPGRRRSGVTPHRAVYSRRLGT